MPSMEETNQNSLKNRVALYCRVSTNKQTNENQKIKLLQYAESKNLQFDFFEEVESTRKTRPVKAELLKKLRNQEYSHVVVYKLDRFARSFSELILDVQELVNKGIGFISITENLDFSTSSGQLQFRIMSAFANFERDIISERTKEGIARTKMKGTVLGRPKGKKDSKPRPKSGYVIREASKRKKKDEEKGVFQSIETYIK
jgi:putative DNA-invertase from lambdoid prophage Rac